MTSQIRVDEITNRSGLGTVTIYDNGFEFTGVTTFTENVDITGGLTIGGVLTYEDVTNIDSVGVVTARGGLDVSDTGTPVNIDSTNSGLNKIHFKTGGTTSGYLGNSSTYFFSLSDSSGNQRVRHANNGLYQVLDTSGNVIHQMSSAGSIGIGTAPIGTLTVLTTGNGYVDINGSGGDGAEVRFLKKADRSQTYTIQNNGGANELVQHVLAHSSGRYTWLIGGTERLRITSGGDLLIDTTNTNPTANNVDGTAILSGGGIRLSRDGEPLGLNRGGSDGVFIDMRRDGTSKATMGVTSNALQFSTAGTERLRLDDVGRLTITGQGLKLSATASSLYSLDGSLSYYATSNGVYLNGAGTNGWLRLNAGGVENNHNAINIFGGAAGAYISMHTSNNERVRIDSSGNANFKQKVSIGESYAGGEILSIGKSSGTSYTAFHNGGANMGFIGYADQLISGGASNELGIRSQDDILFSTGGNTERMRISSTGPIASNPNSGDGDAFAATALKNDWNAWVDIFKESWIASGGGWGTFWAGSTGAAYRRVSGDTNPNEYVFIGAGGKRFTFDLDSGGNAYFDGTLTQNSYDYAEYFEWEDGNPNNEDRRGYSVFLNANGKIEKATSETSTSDIIGAISGTAAIIGDAAMYDWQGRYEIDEWGTRRKEQVTQVSWTDIDGTKHSYADENDVPSDVVVPDDASRRIHHRYIESSTYDSSQAYVPRDQRREWGIVGLLGKVRVRNDSPKHPNWKYIKTIAGKDLWLIK